jgi:hypothetical protein
MSVQRFEQLAGFQQGLANSAAASTVASAKVVAPLLVRDPFNRATKKISPLNAGAVVFALLAVLAVLNCTETRCPETPGHFFRTLTANLFF